MRGEIRSIVRAWIILCVCVLGASACDRSSTSAGQKTTARTEISAIVSLSPGITETIIELGGRNQLVGISDYCTLDLDPEKPSVAPKRVGSALTPNYEAIARLAPQLIIASEVAGNQLKPLARLGKTVSLPWLDLAQVAASIEQLGQMIGKEGAGIELATQLRTELSVSPQPDAKQVLWALDLGDTGQNETWFIRENSLHGAVLRAAGARNAVGDTILGQPKISAEQLLKLDPELILIVMDSPQMSTAELGAARKRAYQHFARFAPLRAVQQHNIIVIHHAGAMDLGPGVLKLIPVLRAAFAQGHVP